MEEIKDKPKRTQMAFDIPLDIKIRIKTMAAMRNISINEWVRRALIRQLMYEERE